ncbi:MAG TPA: TIGR02266 family protein [Polyangiales bacterium]
MSAVRIEASREASALAAPAQRRAPRVDLNVEIGIDDYTNFYVGFTENVSEGGLFLATYQLRPVGTEVALTFVLPDEHAVSVQGVVRWVRDLRDGASADTPPGLGIEFVRLGEDDKQRIQAYVDRRAPMFYPD